MVIVWQSGDASRAMECASTSMASLSSMRQRHWNGMRAGCCVVRRRRGRGRRRLLVPTRCSSVVEASVGQLIAGGNVFKTIAPTVSAHAVALLTLAQVGATAALAYVACILPGRAQEAKVDDGASLSVDGVDVSNYPIFRHPEVQRAIDYAREAHAGQMRMTGDPYITHCIHTAKILAALVPQQGKKAVETVVAGILHDVVDDTPRSLKDLRENFGADVADLVAGVSRLSYINQLLRRHRRLTAHEREPTANGLTPAEADSLRMMLLGMVDDPRVVLVKLADRLHNMRTIYPLPHVKARAVAQETLAVWCSLASRLGVWAVKAELEDLCFAVLHPETFRELRSGLAEMWSSNKRLRDLRKITKREKRRALIFGNDIRADEQDQDSEEVTTKDLLEAVVPFNMLLDRKRRSLLGSRLSRNNQPKVVRDAEIALAALSQCEEALDKELAISTPYIPGTEVSLSGRLKSLYSTHSKMKRKGVQLDQIYDARALRVVVGDGGGELHLAAIKGCYSLLDVIHRLWLPIGGEFDDYILNPKPSGYQSLHTAVRGPDGAPLEVQIRTQVMHEYAEYGNAAHWLYKENAKAPDIGTTVPSTSAWKPVSKKVLPGHPALRIEGGVLRAAIVVRVDDGGKQLLVAVSSTETITPRLPNGKDRWKVFAYMHNKVSKRWWFAPGHGDWDTYLEKYVLYRDGIYHKQDQYKRPLPAFLELLELSEPDEQEYAETKAMLDQGLDLEARETQEQEDQQQQQQQEQQQAIGRVEMPSKGTTATSRLNNKVRLLRSMLQWEKEVYFEASSHNPDDPSSPVLTEVLIICWPSGDILRMPTGSTTADAARRMGIDKTLVYLNGQLAPPLEELKDGDVIEVRE